MKPLLRLVYLLLLITLLAGCNKTPAAPTPTAVPPTITIEPTIIEETPPPASLPMAVRVNGEGILVSEYEAEINRLQDALVEVGEEMTPEEQKERIISNFIDELLLAQAAAQAGYEVTNQEVQRRIDKMATDIGGEDKLLEWQTRYGYTEDSFRSALVRAIAVAWQRDEIFNAVPTTAEQIHARQLIFQQEGNANQAFIQLTNGTDFTELAEAQDPVLGGDLGWFPRGTLTQPVVEEAVFALQPGQYTDVVKSNIGYHIVQVIEREPDHELSVEARMMLQEIALQDWLAQARSTSEIEILVP